MSANGKSNAQRLSDLAAVAIAAVRAAAGDYTGVAVEGAKHAKQIVIGIAVALFIIMLPLLMVLFALNSAGTLTQSSETGDVVTSTGLIGFIERHEGFAGTGFRGVDYQNVTIGYGHVVQEGETFTTLTPEQAEELLKKDLPVYEQSVNKEFADTKLTQYQHDALVDFAYGLGPYIWPKASRLVNDIKSGAPALVLRDDFTAWDYCNGKEVRGLYNRRYDDWRLFEYGDYGCDSADGV